MTSEDVILIIDEICDKCGIAVNSISEIIPAFASYKIAGYLSGVIIAIIMGVAILTPCYLFWKKENGIYTDLHPNHSYLGFSIFDDGSGMLIFLFCLSIIYLVVGLSVIIFCIPTLVQWIVSPEAAFISYILNFI